MLLKYSLNQALFLLFVLLALLDCASSEIAKDRGFYETNQFTNELDQVFDGLILHFMILVAVTWGLCRALGNLHRGIETTFILVMIKVWLANNLISLYLFTAQAWP